MEVARKRGSVSHERAYVAQIYAQVARTHRTGFAQECQVSVILGQPAIVPINGLLQDATDDANNESVGKPQAGRRKRGARPVAPRVAALHYARMNFALIVAAVCLSVLGAGCNSGDPAGAAPSAPAPLCPLPDSGELCTCPGSSVCTGPEWVVFKCLDSGAWEKTDLSCVLGLNCRASADCMAGQACCGDPYTGWWGTQITSSSCQPAPCSSDTVQLCQSAAECVEPGFACGAQDLAYGDGSVLNCSPAPEDAGKDSD